MRSRVERASAPGEAARFVGAPAFEHMLARLAWPNSRVGAIAQWAASAIVEGRLRAGDDLNSVDLARRFDTSRTPVREALLLLEKQGLVQIEARRRPRVKQWSRAEIRDTYRIRAALYAFLSELIVADASDDQLRLLDASYEALAEAASAQDVATFFWANVEFRDTEAQICGNLELQRTLDSLGLRVLQLRHHSISLPNAMADSCADRGRLLRAYHERDATLACALNRSVVLRALERIEHSAWKGMEA